MIDPGKMRDRITIQRTELVEVFHPSEWPDEEGWYTVEEVTSDVVTAWAQFRPTTGREFRSNESAQTVGEEKAVFSIQYREDIRQVDKLVHRGRGGNRIWNIRSVVPVGFKGATDLHCTASDSVAPAP